MNTHSPDTKPSGLLTTGRGKCSKPKPRKPADMKTSRNQTNLQTHINAGRAVFQQFEEYIAELEIALGHKPGFVVRMLLGGFPVNPCPTGFAERDAIEEECEFDIEPVTDEEIPWAAREITGQIGCLATAPLKVHRTASRRVESVIRRHRKTLASV